MRIIVLAGLAVGAIAVFAPEHSAGLMQSVVRGFGWGIGREIAFRKFRQLQSHSVASSEDVERDHQNQTVPAVVRRRPKQDAVESSIDARAIGGKRMPRDVSVRPRTRRQSPSSPVGPRFRAGGILDRVSRDRK